MKRIIQREGLILGGTAGTRRHVGSAVIKTTHGPSLTLNPARNMFFLRERSRGLIIFRGSLQHRGVPTSVEVGTPPPAMSQETTDSVQWFAREVQPYEPTLRAYLQQRFPNLDDVDDIVQESYLKLLRSRLDGQLLRCTRSMLFIVARNLSIDRLRRQRRAPFATAAFDQSTGVADEAVGVAEAACRDQELALLAEALESLPARCRDVLRLRKIHGLSHREIAAQLNLSERTVNSEIGHGIRLCAAFLQARGLPVGEKEAAS